MKRTEDDGHSYPAPAYAYAPDKRDPSTWRIRLWESDTGLNESLVVEAMSRSLTDIPEPDRLAVNEKIVSAWNKLNEAADAISEAKVTISLVEYAPLENMPEDSATKGRVATVVIVKPGFNSDQSRYYPAEMLKEYAHLFEGAKMYRDHDTERERRERPVGSIDRWAAVLKNVRVREDDRALIGDAHIVDERLRTKLTDLREAGFLKELGVSLRAFGKGVRQKVEGVMTTVIEAFEKVLSVDFVTEAGAQGMVLAFESASNLGTLDLDTLREARPDLDITVKAYNHGEDTMNEAQIESLTKQLREATERILALESAQRDHAVELGKVTEDRDAFKARVEEADKTAGIAETQKQVGAMLTESKLPDVVKARIVGQFNESATFDAALVTKAIECERTYLASLQEAGSVRGLGPSGDGEGDDGEPEGTDELMEAMTKSYQMQHPGISLEEAKQKATLAVG